MLVLTRKEDQKVVIPGLDISIKIVKCKSSAVTLGFDAPPEIRIIRSELDSGVSVNDPGIQELMNDKVDSYPDQLQHDARNKLNIVTMALQMLLDDIESGDLRDIDDVFESVCQRLRGLKATKNDDNAVALVVEDQENERELLAGILRMNGYKIATASNGNEALRYIEDYGAPSFILVDMHMPECDGAELVREIRESLELKDVRVYIVSGSHEEEHDVTPNSIDGWYTKPLAPQKLINAMASAGH